MRFLDFSEQPCRVSTAHRQIVVSVGESSEQIPAEDVAAIVIGRRDVWLTGGVLGLLGEVGAPVITLTRDYLPASVALPVSTHHLTARRARAQLSMKRPQQKQLWASVVRAKIRAQAATLDYPDNEQVAAVLAHVRSGDPANREAQAARLYWARWSAGFDWTRSRYAHDLANSMLNYGYTVLRAMVARAAVASGLVPSVGIFHHNRGNPFCLADDLIEPLRPAVDQAVRQFLGRQGSLTPATKRVVVESLTSTVSWMGGFTPLDIAIPSYVASFARVVEEGGSDVVCPEMTPHAGAK